MAERWPEHVVIAGAGLAGSLLAVLLAQQGRRVTVLERRPDPRVKGFIGGRSINLALSVRGIEGLRRAGLAERVLADAIAMPGRMVHARSGETAFQPYSRQQGRAINSVSRGGLNITLLEAADEHEGVTLRFGERCEDVDLDTPAVMTVDESGKRHRYAADLVVGADGAFSAVRQTLQRREGFDYSQDYLDHGYKELHIPPAAEAGVDPALHDGFALDPHALHIWPRGGSMMIALPNRDKTFTCTLFWPFKGRHSFEQVQREGDVRAFFEREYRDAARLMPTLEGDYAANPTSSLVTIRCKPWHVDGRIVLIGDAAHAIVPFYGQGMNAAFEDCVLLADALAAGGSPEAVERFAHERYDDANAIADLALANFIEMRDKVGSRTFRLWKRTEKALDALLGPLYTPLYDMISFSTVPYGDARRRARLQNAVVLGLASLLGVVVLLVLALLARQITMLAALILAALAAALLVAAVGLVGETGRG